MSIEPSSEPSIREFVDRAVIRLLEFPPNLAALLRITHGELAASLDFSRAVQINRILIPEDLKGREPDVIYRIPYIGTDNEALVYMLVESQSQPARAMPLRLLGGMDRIWEMQWKQQMDEGIPASQCFLDPVIPFVFYTGKRTWTSNISLSSMMRQPPIFSQFTPGFEVLVLSLNGFTEEQFNSSAIAAALRVLLVADGPLEVIEREIEAAMKFLEALPKELISEWRMAVKFVVELVRHKRIGAERVLLYNVIDEMVTEYHRPEVREMAMTISEEDIAKGHVKGVRDGQLNLIVDMLEAKFGLAKERAMASLVSKSDTDLALMGRRLLNAQSPAELGL